MTYNWDKEQKEIKRYLAMTREQLEKIYKYNHANLNLKYAIMEKYRYGIEEDMNEDEVYDENYFIEHFGKEKSEKMLNELVEANHGSSLVFYARTIGDDKKGNQKKQIEILNKAIDIGFLPAFDDLFNIYHKNKAQLKKVIEKGMALDYGKAYYWYAIAYKTTKKKLYELLHYSADILNCDSAQQYLSTLYDIKGDKQKSLEYTIKAANNYNTSAMLTLGNYYRDGIMVEKNIDLAIKWYKTVIEYSEKDGRHELAILYRQIGKETEAYELFYQNHIYNLESEYELGKCYRDGIGCEVNEMSAFECFLHAVEHLFEYAVDLAECYYKGIGSKQNYKQAYYILTDVAEGHPHDSYDPEKFAKMKSELEELRCCHCGEFNTKTIKNGIEICKNCGKNWNEMTLNITKKLEIEDITINDIKICAIGGTPSYNNVKYISDTFSKQNDNYRDYEHFWAIKSDNKIVGGDDCILGGIVCKIIQNPEVKPYADINEPILSICLIAYNSKKTFDAIINSIEIYARAQGIRIIEFEANNSKFQSFYNKLAKYKNVKKVGKYFILLPKYQISSQNYGNLQIRHAEIGEEYDIGVGSPKEIQDDETFFGYLESDNMKYSLALNYIVAYDNLQCLHKGYAVGYLTRVSDYKTYNCFFLKDFFVDTESDEKYDYTNKLFKFLIDFCKFHLAEYIKIKINPNKHYSLFYNYCKNTLGFVEKEGYLIKNLK